MTCNVKPWENPCRATGVGPSCFTPITISTEEGSGSSGLTGNDLDTNPVLEPPENIQSLYKEPCCEDCEEPGATDDGGTGDGTDDGGIGEGGDEVLTGEDDGITGFTVEDPGSGIVDDGNNKGNEDKKKCIERIRKRIDSEVQACLCGCFQGNQATFSGHGSSHAGASHWCWGHCIEQVESNFQECFCRDVICQTEGDDDEAEDGETDDEDTDPSNKPGVRYETAELGPHIKQVNFPTSTYEAVIPLVYNHGVVSGNIFWASESRVNRKCLGEYATDADGDITVSSTYVEQTYIDFALGLCEGEIAGIARIWLKDALIYNNTLETDADGNVVDGNVVTLVENLTMFNKSEKGIDKYDKTTMEIRVYTGSEHQPIDPTMYAALADSAPAYRGLAYIVFRNFEITAFNGSIPDLKIEVVRNPVSTAPKQESALVDGNFRNIKPDLLWFDVADRRFYLGADANIGAVKAGIRALNYNTLEEVAEYAPGLTDNVIDEDFDYRTFTLSPQGNIMLQTGEETGTRPLQIINTATAYGRQQYGTHTGNIEHTTSALANMGVAGGHLGGFVRTRDANGTYREMFVAVADNDVAYLRALQFGQFERIQSSYGLNFTPNTVHAFATIERNKSVNTGQTFVLHKYNDFYLATVPSGTANAITLYRGVGFSTASPQYFDPEAAFESFVIDASVWGGFTSGVEVQYILPDDRYAALFIAMKFTSGGGAFIKWNVNTEAVEWSVSVPSMPPYTSPGPRATPESTKYYHWIGSDNNIYSLNKRTGILAVVGNVVDDYELADIAGAQFYDTVSQSISYITDEEQVARVFIGRVFSGTTLLSDIVADIMDRAGLQSFEYDVDALLAVEVDGYVIESNVTLQAALMQLALIYGFTPRQRGSQIVFTLEGVPSGLSLSETNTNKEITRVSKVEANAFRAARVTYYDVDAGMAINTQVVTSAIQPPRGQSNTGEVVIDYPFASSAAFAAALAERLLFDATINTEEVEISAGPSMLTVEPGDYVTVYIEGLEARNYLVEDATVGADKSLRFRLRRYDTDGDLEVALQPQPPIANNDTGSNDPNLLPVSGYKPIAIATNPVLNSQTRSAYDRVSALYGAVAHTGTDPFVPQPLYARSPTGSLALKGTPTRPLDFGTCLTLLAPSSDLGTDKETELVVRFAQPGAYEVFVAADDHDTFYANEYNNTLYVGGELIQFRNWTIDPDGVTYTFTNLLRGRRGTEFAMNSHEPYEFVAAYSPDSWVLIEGDVLDELGDQYSVAVKVGIPAAGQFAEEPVYVDHDFIKFYSPGKLLRSVSSGGDIVLSAVNRVRTEDITEDLEDSPTPESVYLLTMRMYILSAPYEEQAFLAALEGNNPGYILRNSTGGTTFTYTASAQAADAFNRATDTLHVVAFIVRATTDTLFPVPRGHANYRAIEPSYKS